MTFVDIRYQNSLAPSIEKKMMRHLFLLIAILICSSCAKDDEEELIGREAEYELLPANAEYLYEGRVLFRDLKSGGVEITIELSGNKGDAAYYFPAHLHHGAYDTPEAPMAAMLNPVDIRTLKSVTVVNKLATGEPFRFDDLDGFDGHIKVHLADDGPDYHVILVAGNIGKNKALGSIALEKITMCLPN